MSRLQGVLRGALTVQPLAGWPLQLPTHIPFCSDARTAVLCPEVCAVS